MQRTRRRATAATTSNRNKCQTTSPVQSPASVRSYLQNGTIVARPAQKRASDKKTNVQLYSTARYSVTIISQFSNERRCFSADSTSATDRLLLTGTPASLPPPPPPPPPLATELLLPPLAAPERLLELPPPTTTPPPSSNYADRSHLTLSRKRFRSH
jgi:hypothetical protein